MRREQEAEFRAYVDASRARHHRVAFLISGQYHDAEDLVQHALVQLYVHWRPVIARGNPDAYVRQTILNKFIDTRRSAYNRHEERRAEVPEALTHERAISQQVADQDQVSRALAGLSRLSRSIVVLRWYEQLSVEETAAALGCSDSTVKRHAKDALAQLRQALAGEEV